MKITAAQVDRFNNMVREFAMKNGLCGKTEHTHIDGYTEITFESDFRVKKYRVYWNEVQSLTDAGTKIFADAMNFFGLIKNNYSAQSFEIKKAIFSNPATIVIWADGTKTVVKCQEDDVYSEEVGLALCFAKKALGNKSNFNNVFKKWVPEKEEEPVVIGVDPFSVKSPAEIIAEVKKAITEKFGKEEV